MQKSSPPANSPTKFGCWSQDTQLSQKLRRIIFCEYLYIPRGHIRVQDVSWIFNIFSAQKMGPPMFGAFYKRRLRHDMSRVTLWHVTVILSSRHIAMSRRKATIDHLEEIRQLKAQLSQKDSQLGAQSLIYTPNLAYSADSYFAEASTEKTPATFNPQTQWPGRAKLRV